MLSIVFLQRSEPMSVGAGIALTAAILILTLVGIGVGGYIFVRLLARVINQRRDSWEMAAAELGLSVDHSSGAINKDMAGVRDGRSVRVSRYAVPTDETSYDQYAAVEVSMQVSLAFSFKITRPEMLYQRVADFFTEGIDIGHEPFDKAFSVETSDTPNLIELLNVEMLDGENSNLIGDLLAAKKKFHRVVATDRSITLSVKVDFHDASPIEPTLKRAITIAERFEKAVGRI